MHLTRPFRYTAAAAAGLVLLGGGLAQQHPARAFAEWCFDDPIVSINGIQLQTLIGAMGDPSDINHNVQSAQVTYVLPPGVSGSVVSTSNPFFKEKVNFATAGDDGKGNGDDHGKGKGDGSNSQSSWQPGQPITVTVVVSFKSKATYPTQMVNNEGAATLATSNGDTQTGLTATFTLQ